MDNSYLDTINPQYLALRQSGVLEAFEQRLTLTQAIKLKSTINKTSANTSESTLAADPNLQRVVREDIYIPMSDGLEIPGRVYMHANATSSQEGMPVVVFYHRGGRLFGDLDGQDSFLCRLVNEMNRRGRAVKVVSVNYRHMPEFVFPRIYDDCWDAFEYIASNNSTSKIIVAGESAGGGLAASVALRETERVRAEGRKNRIDGALLSCPCTCHISVFPMSAMKEGVDPSHIICANSTGYLTSEEILGYWNLLLPNQDDYSHCYISPALLSGDQLKGFPRTALHLAGMDPVRDVGILFAKRLEEAGVEVGQRFYAGLPHNFFMLPELNAAAEYYDDAFGFLEKLLNGQPL